MKKLTELGIKHNTDKATRHLFTEIYDAYFERFTNPSILEIGVFHGGSLLMYDEYYGGECTIVGLDDRHLSSYKGNGRNMHIIVGDQSKREDLKKCIAVVPAYDIIVDDGGHFMKEQQISFSFLFDYVKNGGIYILEDLHTSFSGYYNPRKTLTTLNFLAQLKEGKYTKHSPYINADDFNRLKRQIEKIEIFWKTPEQNKKNSITSVITKK